MINKPYKKQYNEDDICINEITGRYLSLGKNRRQRRVKIGRFFGNGNNHPIVILGSLKYKKRIQIVPGENKRIEHYDLIK